MAGAAAPAETPSVWTPAPGEYQWTPELAPAGPVLIVVSLPLQQLHVYRNGVRIGASTISSGKPGHETPTGVFTILQKRVEHYSNLYDSAPMPYMQRLTWDGVAMHAGRLPGHPASHGCIRLPDAFAKRLFQTTRHGDVVVVTASQQTPALLANDALIPAANRPSNGRPAPQTDREGQAPRPALSALSVVLSSHDRRAVVMRDGTRIDEAPISIDPALRLGTRVFVLLQGHEPRPSLVLPERPARRWMSVAIGASPADPRDLQDALREGRLALPAAFAARVDELLEPGATVVLTDEPLEVRAQGAELGLEPAGAVHE